MCPRRCSDVRSPEWNECFAFCVHADKLWDTDLKLVLFSGDGICMAAGSIPLALPAQGTTHHAMVSRTALLEG